MKLDDTFEKCMKCSLCSDWCPLAGVVTPYPGPKQAGPDEERYRLKDPLFFDNALKYCLNCKRCEVACPSDVRIGDLVLKARLKYEKTSPHVLRNLAMADTDFVGPVASAFAPVANLAASVLMPHGGPRYSHETFEKWFRREALPLQGSFADKVAYFHGCYVNYNNPGQGRDFVRVMNALGYGVELLEGERCCGVALMSNGFESLARRSALANIAAMTPFVAAGRPVLTTSSTCTLTMRDEYPEVLDIDNSSVRDSIVMATKFIYEALEAGRALGFRAADRPLKVAYHTACHMSRLGWAVYSIELLKLIPGLELTVPEQNCCGVAGTYGFKPENRKNSKAMGSRLFADIEAADPDIVVTDCETCRWQIELCTGRKVLNPISLLAEHILA